MEINICQSFVFSWTRKVSSVQVNWKILRNHYFAGNPPHQNVRVEGCGGGFGMDLLGGFSGWIL